MWATMNNRLTILEEKCHEVDTVKAQMYEIQTSLAQIQTDLTWIKSNLSKQNKQNARIQTYQNRKRANPIKKETDGKTDFAPISELI